MRAADGKENSRTAGQADIRGRFGAATVALAKEARRMGLTTPSGFLAPPRSSTLDRAICHPTGNSDYTISVRLRGRTFAAVLFDCIDGIIIANELKADQAHRARDRLWRAIRHLEESEMLSGQAA